MELVAEARERSGQAHLKPLEIGVRGFVAKPTTTLLLDFGLPAILFSFSLCCIVHCSFNIFFVF